ncbi:putative CAP [Capsicum annuum]|nr:putative CAP [Capsicum annuum]
MEFRRRRKLSLKPIETKGKDHIDDAAEEEGLLSPSARLFHEPNFNVHVVAIMGIKSRINFQKIKENLVHTLLKHPRFSSLQVVDEKNNGEMKWVRTKVDLDKHIVVTQVDDEQSLLQETPDKFVENYIQNLSKTHLDKSKPMWDLHLLNVKTSDAEAVSILRCHHSFGDGTSLVSLLLACTRQTADPDKVPTIPRLINPSNHSTKGSLWRPYVQKFWSFIKLFWYTIVDVLKLMATIIFFKDTTTPIKSSPGSEFNPRRIVYRTVSLDDMKLVKNALNMTITGVALGVTQAGLSIYLNRRYGEGKKDRGATEKNNNLPMNIRLRSAILMNLRPSVGIQALADMMDKDTSEAKWGNLVGFVLVPFKIALQDEPLDYIRGAKATIDRKKNSLEAIYTSFITELALKFFGIKTSSWILHKTFTNTTMCFSCMPGAQEEISFYGHPLAYLAPGSYGQPQGLMINYQSYINKMAIVLSVDESVIPDPHQLLDDFEQSLKLIKDAVVENVVSQHI